MPELRPHSFTVKCKDGEKREFVVKETTAKNRDFIHEKLAEYQKTVQEAAQALLEVTDLEKMDLDQIKELQITTFDKYGLDFQQFCWLTEGPHEMLDPADFNIKLTEAARAAFLPESGTTIDVLQRYLG